MFRRQWLCFWLVLICATLGGGQSSADDKHRTAVIRPRFSTGSLASPVRTPLSFRVNIGLGRSTSTLHPAFSHRYSTFGLNDTLHSGFRHDWHSGLHFNWHTGTHRGWHTGTHWGWYRDAFGRRRLGWHTGTHFDLHTGTHRDWHMGFHHDWHGGLHQKFNDDFLDDDFGILTPFLDLHHLRPRVTVESSIIIITPNVLNDPFWGGRAPNVIELPRRDAFRGDAWRQDIFKREEPRRGVVIRPPRPALGVPLNAPLVIPDNVPEGMELALLDANTVQARWVEEEGVKLAVFFLADLKERVLVTKPVEKPPFEATFKAPRGTVYLGLRIVYDDGTDSLLLVPLRQLVQEK